MSNQYSLRERLNLYGGPLVGAAFAIAFTRYASLGDLSGSFVWPASVVLSSANLTLPVSFIVGLIAGKVEADDLRRKRKSNHSRSITSHTLTTELTYRDSRENLERML